MKISYINENREKIPLEHTSMLEKKYLLNVFEHIKQASSNDNLVFFVTYNQNHLPEYKDKIVFLLGDEHYRTPAYHDKVKLIFKNYFHKGYTQKNIYGMPLPPVAYYNEGEDLQTSLIKFEDRPVDIFFRGNVNSRPHFYKYMSGIFYQLVQNRQLSDLKYNIAFTDANGAPQGSNGFRNLNHHNALQPTSFISAMAHSKVCLCPRGTSVETFRHAEALRGGCLVISDKLPEAQYYEDSSFYMANHDWTNLPQILNEIFDAANKEKTLNTHKKMLQLWEDRFSEKAVANNIISIIKNPASYL